MEKVLSQERLCPPLFNEEGSEDLPMQSGQNALIHDMVSGGPDATVVTLIVRLHVHSNLFCSAIHSPIQIFQMVRSYDRWNTLICQRHVRFLVDLWVAWYVDLVIPSGLVRVRDVLVWPIEECLFAIISAYSMFYGLKQILLCLRVSDSQPPGF